jgi:hypothetical protein
MTSMGNLQLMSVCRVPGMQRRIDYTNVASRSTLLQ